jgi:hypothetical protein
MTNEPLDDNVRSRTESDPDRSAAGDPSRDDTGSLSETDRHNRNLCIPEPTGIFVDPQLTIDPQPIRRLTDLGARLESRFSLKKAKPPYELTSRDSPPTLGIDSFCC